MNSSFKCFWKKVCIFKEGKMIFGAQRDQVVDILFHPKDGKQVATDLLRLSTHFSEWSFEWGYTIYPKTILKKTKTQQGFPGGTVVTNLPMQETQQTLVQSLSWKIPWSRKWQHTPIFLPGKFHGQRSLASCSPRSRKESDTAARLSMHAQEATSWDIYTKW